MLNLIFAAGAQGIFTSFVSNWAGPIFLVIVVVGAITLGMRRQFRELGMFVLFMAIIGAIIFGAAMFFGENGLFTNIATEGGQAIANTISMFR